MEGTEHFSLCILCCYSFPTANSSPTSSNEKDTLKNKLSVEQFIHQTGVVTKLSLSSLGLVDPEQVSFCPKCLSGVIKVVGKREQVEEMEGKVRRLQEEILGLMRQLRGLITGYLEEMRRLEDKVRSGDEISLIKRFGGRRGRMKNGSWSKENALKFRSGVFNVVKDLSDFRDDLGTKLMSDGDDAALKQEKSVDLEELSIKVSEVKVEPEPSAYHHGDDIPDFYYSPSLRDNSEDEDYILPESPKNRKASGKCPSRTGEFEIREEDDPLMSEENDVSSTDSDFIPSSKTSTSAKGKRKARTSNSGTVSVKKQRPGNNHHGLILDEAIKAPAAQISHSKPENDQVEFNDDKVTTDKPPGYLPMSKRQKPSWYTSIRFKSKNRSKCQSNLFCLLCPDFIAKSSQALEQHLRAHERDSTPAQKVFQCSYCPTTFATEQYSQLHLYYHQGLFQTKCDQCNLFHLTLNLKTHLKKEHGVQHFMECANCSYINSKRENYLDHLQIYHKGKEAIMACDLCPEKFPMKKHLLLHYKNVHGESVNEEKYKEVRRRQLVQKKARERVLCPECGKSLKPDSLKDHMECVHSNNARPYPCPHCPNSFKTSGNLYSHLRIHRRDESGFQFQCHLCSKGFKAKGSLEAHMRLHEGTGLTCDKCGKMFGNRNFLAVHLRMHEKNDKMEWWQCTKCAFKFRTEQKLRNHERVHEKKIENRCGVCDKVFNKPFYLKAHYLAMHSDKRFECNVCGLSCNQESNLRQHKKRKHPEEYKASLTRPRKKQSNLESVRDNDGISEEVKNELAN